NAFTQPDVDFLSQIAGQIAIAVDNALAYRQISELKDQLTQEKLYLENELRSEMNFEDIIGNSTALRKVLRQVEAVAPTGSTVLIQGETGSGKELIARAVHNLSQRRKHSFVQPNCAARRFLPVYSRASCLGTRKGRLRGLSHNESAVSNWHRREPYS